MFRRLSQLFSKKLQKVPHFGKKHEKSSIWPNLELFRANHRVSAFGSTFQQKSCKKCLISRKSMKNRRFGQNVQLFRANCRVLAFGSAFQQKVAKSASFREKV